MQTTIKKPVSVEDIGIHSGKKVALTLKPAPADHGIEFVRTDLKKNVKISTEVFDGANNQSCIIKDGEFFVKTIEHIMSAIYVLGINNIIIEVSNVEMPILDGSAGEFVKLIKKAGIEKQKGQDILEISLKKIVFLQGKEDTYLVAIPSNKFKISLAVSYEEPVGTQILSLDVDQKIFSEEIAPARTLGWMDRLENMWANGLGKGVSMKNAIGISKQGYSCPLRYPDEIVRHKMMDLIGDLSGLRGKLKAHVIGFKTNHRLNIQFMKKLASLK